MKVIANNCLANQLNIGQDVGIVTPPDADPIGYKKALLKQFRDVFRNLRRVRRSTR